jgi:hypothetical protein
MRARVVRREAKRLLRAAHRGQHTLAVALLRAAEPAVRRAAIRVFLGEATKNAPSRRHVEAVDQLVGRQATSRGEVRIRGDLAVRVAGGALLLGPARDARTRGGENATKAQDH